MVTAPAASQGIKKERVQGYMTVTQNPQVSRALPYLDFGVV